MDPDFSDVETIRRFFADQSLAGFEEVALKVLEEEGPESGRTKPAPDGAKIRVAIDANRETFEQTLLTVWNWKK